MHGNHTEQPAVEMTRASRIWAGNGVWTNVDWEIFLLILVTTIQL